MGVFHILIKFLFAVSGGSDSERSKTDKVAMGKYDSMKKQDLKIVERVYELSKKYNCKMSQIALAWQWMKDIASPLVGAINHNPQIFYKIKNAPDGNRTHAHGSGGHCSIH